MLKIRQLWPLLSCRINFGRHNYRFTSMACRFVCSEGVVCDGHSFHHTVMVLLNLRRGWPWCITKHILVAMPVPPSRSRVAYALCYGVRTTVASPSPLHTAAHTAPSSVTANQMWTGTNMIHRRSVASLVLRDRRGRRPVSEDDADAGLQDQEQPLSTVP